ncbi:twin-arginine translocase TatA/TatE family subunit [Candidatus Sulfurimonas marisnigri]|uniref:Sec-independent protein translocase protein TatA n=1 Tax=Candidatus Sulfurimonas marisnigri TaxID=2740405 RepID=A0A7S7RQ49_9BACT|nr:twin-arginine translocase TatA/TatE family subunit [Candidatus Sulfurimonas marisnigri]QOY54326.1 twin-arginine translocase TatA/TatE family subunit [Candidatus Sulfurimonas marisnigri]
MGMPGGTELLIILAIVVLLFGAKKIPDLAKGLGKGIKNFKSEMKEIDEVETASTEAPKKVEGSEETASTEAPKQTTQA